MRPTPLGLIVGALYGCAGVPPTHAPPPSTRLAARAPESKPIAIPLAAAPALPAAPARPVAPFDAATTMTALVVVEGRPRCEPWAIVPDATTPTKGQITATWKEGAETHQMKAGYAVSDHELRLEGIDYFVGDEFDEGNTCEAKYPMAWDGSELSVGTARWFSSPDACQQAIDSRRRVAMDLSDCDYSDDDPRAADVSDDVRARSLRTFRRRLRTGGRIYVVDDDDRGHLSCMGVRVLKGEYDDGELDSGLTWIDRGMSDDGKPWRVTASLELYDRPAEQHWASVLQPDGSRKTIHDAIPQGYGVTFQEAFTSEGYESLKGDEGFGLGCGDIVDVRGAEGGVEIARNPHYFRRSDCEHAIKRELSRRRWFPIENDDDDDGATVATTSFGPGIGGC